jgi:NhaP-type Na+/H+ or K+/H+ antiporter
MDVIDLLITIVVVTILVTIILAVVTYVAYKLRLAREPSALDRAEDGLRYFVRYAPPGASGETAPSDTAKRHATEA